MDNALKLLIGVLSISGLLAMLVPTKPPTIAAEPAPVAQAVSAESAPEQPTAPTPEPNTVVTQDYTEELSKFGQPMNDAKPFGATEEPAVSSEQPNMPAMSEMTSENQTDTGAATPVS